MTNLAEMSTEAKLGFALDVIEDAAAMLRRQGNDEAAARYISYVREMRGEQQTKEDSHE